MKYFYLFIAVVVLTACSDSPSLFEATTNIAVSKKDDTPVSVHFCPGQCMNDVVKVINKSKKSVHIAMYSLNSAPIVDALLNAHKRGIKIKVLFDEIRYNRSFNFGDRERHSAYPKLEKAGIQVKLVNYGYERSFHHKFVIIDQQHVFTGSLNFNKNSVDKIRENFLIINNTKIASLYVSYFDDRWNKKPLQQNSQGEFHSKDLDVYFGPGPQYTTGLIDIINNAKETIHMAVVVCFYSPIVQALLEAKKRNVDVNLIMSYGGGYPFYKEQEIAAQTLIENGIKVYKASPPPMHHKFTVVDGSTLATGSPGYDQLPMTKTHEDYVIVRNEKIAAKYLTEFNTVLKEATLRSKQDIVTPKTRPNPATNRNKSEDKTKPQRQKTRRPESKRRPEN